CIHSDINRFTYTSYGRRRVKRGTNLIMDMCYIHRRKKFKHPLELFANFRCRQRTCHPCYTNSLLISKSLQLLNCRNISKYNRIKPHFRQCFQCIRRTCKVVSEKSYAVCHLSYFTICSLQIFRQLVLLPDTVAPLPLKLSPLPPLPKLA